MKLCRPFENFKKIYFYLILGCVIIGCLTVLDIWVEEGQNEANLFIYQDKRVIAQVGEIQTIKLQKWRRVSSSDTAPGYREFRFYVRGRNQDAVVILRAQLVEAESVRPSHIIVAIDAI